MSLALDLSSRVVLITGSSGQLGRVMARRFAEAGASVALHYHQNRGQAESLLAELESDGARALLVQADVTSLTSVQAMAAAIRGQLGQPDVIVANAVSQIQPWRSVLDEDLADYEDQFRSCVMQNVHLAKVFIPPMLERGFGRYIGINTECSMQMHVTQSAYVSGKRGMDGVLRVLAKEVGPGGVTVN